MKQKTDDLMEATNLKEPLKRLDAAAAQHLTNVEQRTFEVSPQSITVNIKIEINRLVHFNSEIRSVTSGR